MNPFIYDRFSGEEYLLTLVKNKKSLQHFQRSLSQLTQPAEFFLANEKLIEIRSIRSIRELRREKRKYRQFPPAFRKWAEGIVSEGKRLYDEEAIVQSLFEADRKSMFASYEIRSAALVIAIEIMKSFSALSVGIERIERERMKAEKWFRNKANSETNAHSHAFFEHALRLEAEEPDAQRREYLLSRLALLGRSEEDVIRLSAEEEGEILVRLQNLTGLMHTVNAMNMEKTFGNASYTEKTLREDPGNIYANMDDASKNAILAQLERLSRRAGVPERLIASKAIQLCKKGDFDSVCDVIYTESGIRRMCAELDTPVTGELLIAPDKNGYRLICMHAAAFFLTVLLSGLILPGIYVLISLPAAWCFSGRAVHRILESVYPAKPILKMKTEKVSEKAATLVMIPALITNEQRALDVLRQIETYGVHEKSEYIDFLLLGDFADSHTESTDGDEAILEAVRREKHTMNLRAGRRKYLYLHRNRQYIEAEGVWMGRERKRGAIEDLNRLIMTGENRFLAEGADGGTIDGRYKYVLTLDADTEMLPGVVRQLIGAMEHPLNRDIGVLQPRMEISAKKCTSVFSQFMAGNAGSDIYNACAQNVFQDYTGQGIFSGKGIYRVERFYERTCGAFRENTVLSHDMIEGILAGAAYAGDIALFEGFPNSEKSYLKRLERWTRGDWQLLVYAFGRIRLKALDRYKIFQNLARSLSDASVLAMLLILLLSGRITALLWPIILFFCPFRPDALALKGAFVRFGMLPRTASVQIGGAVRALYRMYISKRNMLKWVTADEADRVQEKEGKSGWIVLFLLPAFFRLHTLFPALLLGGIFVFGKSALRSIERKEEAHAVTIQEYNYLSGIAKDIWRYFEKHVPLGKFALPPDNIQLDPPKGAAERTSPTNIGMYILSIIGASLAGLIEKSEMCARLREIASAVMRLDTWNGLLFNWYDTRSMQPLSPRYVSSVDSGNLLAALVAARNALKTEDTALAARYEKLIARMEIERLYDEDRKLFRIGYDAEQNRMSASYYDLLASEARILYFTAIAEKGIDVKSWYALARPFETVSGRGALLSWSGTMFEYMMPFLLMPSAKGTLLSDTAESVSRLQAHAAVSGIWGISESGYMAFDYDMNYQYRAFGIPSLAASGEKGYRVIAPYAAQLDMMFSNGKGVENLRKMEQMGLRGEFGFYEAIDFEASETGEIVYSYMTHHQGMAFCAIVNVLTGGALSDVFMKDVREEAFSLLLNEKPFHRMLFRMPFRASEPEMHFEETGIASTGEGRYERFVNPHSGNAHVLSAGASNAYFRSDGYSFYRRNGVYANAWHADPERYEETIVPEIRDASGIPGIRRVFYDTGLVRYERSNQTLKCAISFALSPENGALIGKIRLNNLSGQTNDIKIRQSFKLALSREDDIHAHPVFSDMFIKAQHRDDMFVLYERIRRIETDESIYLLHGMTGLEITEQTNEIGRRATVCIEGECRLAPFQSRTQYFVIALSRSRDALDKIAADEEAFQKAVRLTGALTKSVLRHLGIRSQEYRNISAGSKRYFEAQVGLAKETLSPKMLWKYALSGEKPVMCVNIRDVNSMEALRKMIAIHKFMHLSGMPIPLIVLTPREADYFTPALDETMSILGSCCQNTQGNSECGIHVIEADSLSKVEIMLIQALSVWIVERDFRKEGVIPSQTDAYYETSPILPVNSLTETQELINDNGYGGFLENGRYMIRVCDELKPPVAWANILANPVFGAIVTDRGIGCIWHENSRNGRITPFDNDPYDAKGTLQLYASVNGGRHSLLPGNEPRGAYRVFHGQGESVYACELEGLEVRLSISVSKSDSLLLFDILLTNRSDAPLNVLLSAAIDFLMGTDARDKRFTGRWDNGAFLMATGRIPGIGFCGFTKDSRVSRETAEAEAIIPPGAQIGKMLVVGYASTQEEIQRLLSQEMHSAEMHYERLMDALRLDTGNRERDVFLNGFLKYQTLASRLYARTSLMQPGGAIGLRDQLQDLLSAVYFDRAYAENHILLCAAHQFIEGDAMHWWHPPRTGVRTRISDDVLFLPLVTAEYMRITGDVGILHKKAPYLKSRAIPDGQEDLYFEGEESGITEPLYDHILRAFGKVYKTGEHGLLLMGGGDWNDGMNLVGIKGRGESVWLSEFMVYVIGKFIPYAKKEHKQMLLKMKAQLMNALEEHAWDGEWYIRAYNDYGEKLGSHENKECSIDLISQCWAPLADLRPDRSERAFKSALEKLVDFDHGIIRLLTPPFSGLGRNPGYIAAYPPGYRENGGQYTHAAAWLVKASAKLGYAELSWRLFDMLLPIQRTDTMKKTAHYECEPYVVAADIVGEGEKTGRGGWSWYTGAAAWCFSVLTEDLLGVRIENGYCSMNALLPENTSGACVTIRYGNSEYVLKAVRNMKNTDEPVKLVDDGKRHELCYPVRKGNDESALRVSAKCDMMQSIKYEG